MTPGRVVRIRVNPQDCMGVADVIRALGLSAEKFSFDQAVRVALSSLLESARSHGSIPTRDGFEYGELMSPFQERIAGDRVKRLEVAKLIGKTEIKPVTQDREREKAFRRYEELALKVNAAPESISPEDQRELQELTHLLFPDPDFT